MLNRFLKHIYGLAMKVTGNVMRVVRIRFAALVGVVFVTFIFVHLFIWSVWYRTPSLEDIRNSDEEEEQACRHPNLDHNNPAILKHIQDVGLLDCKREMDWIDIDQGTVKINDIIIKRHRKVDCKLNFLTRVDDFSSSKSETVHLLSKRNKAKLQNDFFHAKCKSLDGVEWKNIVAGVYRNETVIKRVKGLNPLQNGMKVNVLMFGLDSMSRLHYMRKLPRTYRYLKEVLKASVMEGYNIVGDGTPQALIPILTGFTEQELPETRKRIEDANFVNVYPFAWKNFSANGYVTAYAEDCPHTGIFTYRLKGFDTVPTDHYMRTFYVEVEKLLKEHSRLCLGNKPRHTVMLDWLRQFYDVYSDVPKFALGFHGELSHDDYNLVGHADLDIEKFLTGLKESGILNSTILIMFSDHGHRFAAIRETQQGKQEERLPFFALVTPQWMETKYPKLVRNLRINENRLSTPFDIYSTLMTILDTNVPSEGDLSHRSISLFSEIPQDRTCSMAAIEPHWCACLSWKKLSTGDDVAKNVGQVVIDFINKLTEIQRNVCEILKLKEVTRIEKLQPNKALLKYKKNADRDGFVGEFSDNTQVTELIYQIQLRASPSDGVYEASVKHLTTKDEFVVKEFELSRVNKYSNQEHCIHETYPNLRKYCYCKTQL